MKTKKTKTLTILLTCILAVTSALILITSCSDNPPLNEKTYAANDTTGNIPEISEPKSVNYTSDMSDEIWDSLNTENMRFKNKDDFIAETEYYIKAVSEFCSKKIWFNMYNKYGSLCHIEYMLTDGISYIEVKNGSRINVYLKRDYFEHDLAPIANLITHIIVPDNGSLSLSGGLAAYCQDKFGKNPSVHNWGIDPHAFSYVFFHYANSNDVSEAAEQMSLVIGTNDASQNKYSDSQNLRSAFYILSSSFSKYLIDTYGIETFMNIYESDNLAEAYNIYCGKPFEDIKAEWRKIVESSPMTLEEYTNSMTELVNSHNYPID